MLADDAGMAGSALKGLTLKSVLVHDVAQTTNKDKARVITAGRGWMIVVAEDLKDIFRVEVNSPGLDGELFCERSTTEIRRIH